MNVNHAQHTHHNGPGKAKDKDKDEALAVILGKSKGKECKPHGICWNYGDKGHYKDKCPKPVVKKDNSPKKTDTVAANAIIQSDSNNDGVFFMEYKDDTDMPELQLVSDSKDDPESDDNESLWLRTRLTVAGIPRSYLGLIGARLACLSTLTWTQRLLNLITLLPKLELAKVMYLELKYMTLAAPNTLHVIVMLSKILLIFP